MKTSELIDRLEIVMKMVGDLPVSVVGKDDGPLVELKYVSSIKKGLWDGENSHDTVILWDGPS